MTVLKKMRRVRLARHINFLREELNSFERRNSKMEHDTIYCLECKWSAEYVEKVKEENDSPR